MKKKLNQLVKQNKRLYDLLSERLPTCCSTCRQKMEHNDDISPSPLAPQVEFYTEDQLMTVDMAIAELKVSRSKVYQMIGAGELTKLSKYGGTRLIVAEVIEAKKWYSIPKGKI